MAIRQTDMEYYIAGYASTYGIVFLGTEDDRLRGLTVYKFSDVTGVCESNYALSDLAKVSGQYADLVIRDICASSSEHIKRWLDEHAEG